MAIKTEQRNVGPLSVRATVVPDSINVDARTVEVQWGSETPVRRGGYYSEPFDEVLSMDPAHVRMGRLNSGKSPVLDSHNAYGGVDGVRGVISKAKVDGKIGTATLRFAKAEHDDKAERMFGKIRDGIIANVSVGYRVHKFEKQPKADPTNPKEIPVMRAVDWEPYEISPVAIGADETAGFRSADEHPTNSCEFVSRGLAANQGVQEMTEEEKRAAEAKAQEDKRIASEVQAKREAEFAKREADLADRERVTGIQAACRSLGDKAEARIKAFVEAKTSVIEVRATLWDESATRAMSTETGNQIPVTERGEDDSDKFRRGAIAGILSRTGQLSAIQIALDMQNAKQGRARNPDVDKGFKGFDPKDDGGEFRGYSLLDLMREGLERKGISTRGMSGDKLIERSMYARDNGGQQTASDFSVVLENVMYKTLLGQYAIQDDSWRRFSGVDSVQDFRASNRYRLGSFGALDLIDESGEYKQKQIPDGIKQSITTQTYGNKIALSRKAIINDDMGAVIASAGRFGRMAGLSIEVAVYALLALNAGLGPTVTYNGITAPLFDAQFNNISTGAALTMAALEADRVKMANQKDISSNEFLMIRPNSLLVNLGLEGEANVINRAKFDPTAASAFERPNIVGGLFREVIGTPRFTGTRRYLFSDQTPAIIVAFLNGVQTPMMDQRPGWDIDGIEWKLRLDFNAQGFDPIGALTNAGA